MATRVVPTSLDADNPAGSFTLAACSDWRTEVRRFHFGTGLLEPTSMPDIRLQAHPLATTIDQPLASRGESIYEWNGLPLLKRHRLCQIGNRFMTNQREEEAP